MDLLDFPMKYRINGVPLFLAYINPLKWVLVQLQTSDLQRGTPCGFSWRQLGLRAEAPRVICGALYTP